MSRYKQTNKQTNKQFLCRPQRFVGSKTALIKIKA